MGATLKKSLADLGDTVAPVLPTDAPTNIVTLVTEADADAVKAKLRDAAIGEFESFGYNAAKGTGVATDMARRFAQLVIDGVFAHADAAKLYEPYAQAHDRYKSADVDAYMGSNAYASSLSTFATFGLKWTAVVQANIGLMYDRIRELRNAVADKSTTIGSAYQCFVAFNRKANEACESMGVEKLCLLLKGEEGDAWLRGVILKEDATAKDEFARLARAIEDVAKLAKRAPWAQADFLELAKVMQATHDALKVRKAEVAAANEAALIKGATMSPVTTH